MLSGVPSCTRSHTPYLTQVSAEATAPQRGSRTTLFKTATPSPLASYPLVPFSVSFFSVAFITVWKSMYVLICVFIASQQGQGFLSVLFAAAFPGPRSQWVLNNCVLMMRSRIHSTNQQRLSCVSTRHCARARDTPGDLSVCFPHCKDGNTLYSSGDTSYSSCNLRIPPRLGLEGVLDRWLLNDCVLGERT